jgi:putative ABC transport system ATP-binding protein
MLRIHSASLAFGDRQLFHDLDLSVAKGQLVGLSGESGCGKTSLLRAVLGFVPLTTGSIEVCGMPLDVQHIDAIRRQTSYVPQELQPLAAKGRDFVRLTHELEHNIPRQGARLLASFCSALGLESNLMDLDAAKLSGGQRQRLLIAAALSLQKPLLLLDEPTSALDEETTQRMGLTLLKACHNEDAAVLAVSHDPALLAFCDKVIDLTRNP